jgi:hypothetical protein
VSWTEFRDAFHAHYIPTGMMSKKHQEFMDLKQSRRSVHDYSKLFNHLAQYAPDQVDTDEKKKDRFMIGLSSKLQHGAQHWRDISRVYQYCHHCGRCNPRSQGNQEEEGCGSSVW